MEPRFQSGSAPATLEEGITELYRKQIADAYIAGELDCEQAISELGEQTVEDLDYARQAVEQETLGIHTMKYILYTH